ncbi:MAG: HAMP domain-containing histidine kinase [Clostridia bacterium]|nr:HAMP domain-containing histidine kinase [Clostridia bacterium]
MFKTSFSKYLATFVIIIFVSFAILSGVITAMVRNYAFSDTEERLDKECSIVVSLMQNADSDNLGEIIHTVATSISPMVSFNSDYEVIITDVNGKIILSTAHAGDEDRTPVVNTTDGLGNVTISAFERQTGEGGEVGYVYNGRIGESLEDQYMVYAKPVNIDGEPICYVMTLANTNKEHNFVSITRRVVINSSIWVMIAAVVAAYIITERIVKPLRKMTSATKSFAEGDFSTRVDVDKHNIEIAELAKAFNNMAESLESLEKMRNSFLANISHDLRTPMTTISGFIDGINSGAIPPEKHEYYLGVISAEVHRLSRLVTQLLDVSRLESGERKFNYTDFDIAEVARLILISFEQKIEDKKLDVEFDAEYDGMYAKADKDAIYQVLYNLCHNAIKFAREGGKFRIRITRITDTKLKIAVYDQGQSLSDVDAKMVFDRFYKTDESRGLDKTGVGLGLYISKTIIDAHGETIGVDSIANDGCEFWFTLTEGTQPPKRKTLLENI